MMGETERTTALQESTGLVHWGQTSSTTLLLVALIFAALLVAAFIIEFFRQRRRRAESVKTAWALVESIAIEKELTESERNALTAIVKRWDPDEPERAVTLRQHFDICVDKEMEMLRQQGDEALMERIGVTLRDVRVKLALDFVPIGQRIYSTRELFRGQELWLSRESDSPPRWVRAHASNVDEACLYVAPIEGYDPARPPLSTGDSCNFRLYRDEDARYLFSAPFVRRQLDPLELLFRHTSALKRVQAREHFRVRHEQNTNVGIMNAPLDTESPTTRDRRIVTRTRGKITNISAGGFALLVPQAIPAQVLIRVTLELELEATEPFDVDARIVGTTPLPGGRCLVRAAYYDVDDDRRDLIARYVVHRQQRQKEATLAAE